MSTPTDEFDAVIIGAGFSGIYALHKLRQLGLRCRLYETGDGVGGAWYWNRYPGARCDSESYFYCFTFSDEILQEWTWTERFPPHDEIRRYLGFVTDKLGLRGDMRFGAKVTAAVYDDESARWRVDTDAGDSVESRYVIAAVGAISATNVPDIPGLESFSGRWYHTGRWPHEGVELEGRRVGVIGTGSTGMQLIPVVAEQAEQLTVFQRTPNYSMPARNRPLDPAFIADVKANYRELNEITRQSPGGMPLPVPTQSFEEVDPEEARRRYEAAWAQGGVMVLQQFNDLLTNQRSNDFAAEFFREKVRAIVHDPETAETLTPKGYPIAAKRPVLDTDYYETFNKPHVHLVDVNEKPITEITSAGIRAGGVDHELDVIIFATGYDAFTGSFLRMDIRGRNGVPLGDRWADGPIAYLGLGIAGFPNLLTVNGPGSPAVLTNVPATIEHDVEWIADCIAYLEEHGITAFEPTEEAEASWMRHAAELVDGTLYPLANSWWSGANIPGKPRMFMAYTGGLKRFRDRCAEVADAGYEGYVLQR